jgi:hypothetical protein
MAQNNAQSLIDEVAAFVRFIDRRHRNNEFYDTSILPWPKDMIKDLCLQRLRTEPNPLIRRTIADNLLCIVFYQEGVGPLPMQDCRLDLFTMNISSLSEEKLRRVRLTIAEHLPHLESEKFLAILTRVQNEFIVLNDLLDSLESEHASTSFTLDENAPDTSAFATIQNLIKMKLHPAK